MFLIIVLECFCEMRGVQVEWGKLLQILQDFRQFAIGRTLDDILLDLFLLLSHRIDKSNEEAIISIFQMHSNVWNLKSSKPQLSILERTHAQKQHLLNILTAKSRLDTKPPRTPLRHSPSAPSLQQRTIQQDNHSMIRRIVRIGQGKNEPPSGQLSEVVRNLKTYSSLNRSIRLKEIEEQNSKIFSRLIMTSPTIKRQQWIKRNIQTSKYKENLLRSKYPHPDYSHEAAKIIKDGPKFKHIVLASHRQPFKPTPAHVGSPSSM